MYTNDFDEKRPTSRRTFLKTGVAAAGAAALTASLIPHQALAFRQSRDRGGITKGDIAILRFFQAIETIETDFWLQYSELGGTQDNEVSGVGGGNPLYMAALNILDGDMAQYVHDN